jgi:hypothetical protein
VISVFLVLIAIKGIMERLKFSYGSFCIGENITVMRDILGAASRKMKRKYILEIQV